MTKFKRKEEYAKVEPPTKGPTQDFTPTELKFLHAYYDANSPTKGESVKSASAAGYSQAAHAASRILKKHESLVFAGALESVGMTKMTLALRLKRIIDDPEADPKDVLAATRLMLNAFGERTESGGASVNVNVATAPKSLVMVGFDEKGINNMLAGKKPAQLENNGEVSVVEGVVEREHTET